MKTTVQIARISGGMIDNARWEVDFVIPPSEGHRIQVNMPVSDKDLIPHATGLSANGVFLDETKEDGYTVTVTCFIKEVRHMIDTRDNTVQTMVVAAPESKTSENVLMYVIDKTKCEPSFRAAVARKSAQK